MRRFAMLLLSVAFSGCGELSLPDYEPLGPSKGDAHHTSLYLLTDVPMLMNMRVVVGPEKDVTQEQIRAGCREDVEQLIMTRPADPGFRSLCALVNRHWGNWERLIIIERLDWMGDDAYGFVAIGITRGTPRIVTNLCNAEGWGISTNLVTIRPDQRRLRAALKELDKAGEVLPERLLYIANVDQPLYVVHDLKSDGAFSFAICGKPNLEEKGKWSPPPDYAEAAKLINKDEPPPPSLWDNNESTPTTSPFDLPASAPSVSVERAPGIVEYDSPRGRELRLAGRTYACLLTRIWVACMGTEHSDFLGESPPEN